MIQNKTYLQSSENLRITQNQAFLVGVELHTVLKNFVRFSNATFPTSICLRKTKQNKTKYIN